MRIRSAPLLLPILLFVAAVACSNEGEGRPCDHNAGGNPSGTDDCQSPLICVVAPNPAAGPTFRCCPPAGTAPTTFECGLAAGFDANPNPPPSDATTGTDAPAESGDDGPAESASEASPPSEGGTPADAVESGTPADASEGGAAIDSSDAGPADGGPG